MGGKKYFCDYCQVRIQNNPQIIKKHNEGLPHQKCKMDHFGKYRTLKEILETEKTKTPCKRAATNACAFGTFCRFSHYSSLELLMMEEQCKELDRREHLPTKQDQKSIEAFLDERRKVSAGFKNKIYFEIPDKELPVSLRVWNTAEVNVGNDWG